MSKLVIILFFELCNKAVIYGKRVRVMPHDAMFVKDFMRTINPMNPIGYTKPLEAAQQTRPLFSKISGKKLPKA